jgi:hypothetical protein
MALDTAEGQLAENRSTARRRGDLCTAHIQR